MNGISGPEAGGRANHEFPQEVLDGIRLERKGQDMTLEMVRNAMEWSILVSLVLVVVRLLLAALCAAVGTD